MLCPTKRVIVPIPSVYGRITLVLAVILTAPVVWAGPSVGQLLSDAMKRAEKHRKAGELSRALHEYNKILFVNPKHAKAKKAAAKIRGEQVSASTEAASRLWESKPEEAKRALTAAYEMDPGNRAIQKQFKKHGYRWHEGRWLTKDGVREFESVRRSAGDRRRGQLRLAKNFTVLHKGPIRLFTDVDVANAQGNLVQEILQANLSHYHEYVRLMTPLGVRFPVEGIDLVLFDKRHDYMRRTEAPGTAGVYIPSEACGFFYRDGGSVSFPTMLHEMTHQLCHKVLGGLALSGWFEEGMAEYFGAALLTKGGRRLRLGATDAYRLATLHRALSNGGSGLMPLDRFTKMPNAELTGEFYAQSWALVHYLMEGDPVGRLIIYDYVAYGKRYRVESGQPYAPYALESVLRAYGKTLSQLEEEYVRFYQRT